MANKQKHLKQWKHNREFAATIPRKYLDWQINVIFYAALQAVDAALAHFGEHYSDHGERNKAIRRNGALAGLRGAYLDLYRISQVTRYDCEPQDWLPSEYMSIADLVDGLLKPIEMQVETLIGQPLTTKPLTMDK